MGRLVHIRSDIINVMSYFRFVYFALYRMFICSICNLFRANTFAGVLRHIGLFHRFDANLSIYCGINYCPQTYTNYESFRSHVYRKHRDSLHSTLNGIVPSLMESSNSEDAMSIDPEEPVQEEPHEQADIKESGAKFILKLREEYRIPQSTLNKIIMDMRGLWEVSLSSIMENVKDLDMNTSFPLNGFDTEYLQQRYFKQNFNYLVGSLA